MELNLVFRAAQDPAIAGVSIRDHRRLRVGRQLALPSPVPVLLPDPLHPPLSPLQDVLERLAVAPALGRLREVDPVRVLLVGVARHAPPLGRLVRQAILGGGTDTLVVCGLRRSS
jgi:hypothetical protein